VSLLEIKNISKSFGSNKVLSNISIFLEKGEIHSFIGENGAGKSTLMKIIGGIYQADSGQFLINGKEVHMQNPMDAFREGIGIVHQELSVADNMTVAQNVFVNREPTNALGFIKWKQLNEDTVTEFKKIGIDIKPDTLVKTLSVGMQQVVEIVKVLSRDVKILILDEPTSALSDKEISNLFELLLKLKESGTLVIFISHKLKEIKQISDRVSVLRDGNFIGTLEKDEMEESTIIRMMVGREIDNLYPPKAKSRDGEIVLETRRLTRNEKYLDVSLKIKKGEITGMFGLVGSGRTEFAYSLFGADGVDGGEILLNGRPVRLKSPKMAIRYGIGYLSEDRKRTGLFVGMDVKDNVVASSLDFIMAKLGFLDDKKSEQVTEEYIGQLEIRPSNCSSLTVRSLSGGNQQKVLLAKWLAAKPEVLIVDEPTRGVDVGAKCKIHSILRALADSGIAIIMISSELPEILGLSDQVAVMHEGRLITVLENDGLTEETVLAHAFLKGGDNQ